MPLSICVSCNRHIAPVAIKCPFCRTPQSGVAGAPPAARALETGVRRGTLLAAGIIAASVTGFTGCNEDGGPGPDVTDCATASDAGVAEDASEPTDAAPPVDADDWIPTPIYEAIPPRFF